MKAHEWAAKFSAAETDDQKALVLDEFGKETADLITQRTKKSELNDRLMVAEGAIREQRQKYRAFAARVGLSEEQFEDVITKSCTEYRSWQQAKKSAEENRLLAKQQEQENNDGRTFAHRRPTKPERRPQKPQPRKPGSHPARIGDVPSDWVA
jgi:hypothetical protein